MDIEKTLTLIKDFNFFANKKAEERIVSNVGATDTMADIQKFTREIEPEWIEEHKDLIAEAEALPDEDFFEIAEYAMLNNSGVMPLFVEEGLKKRGAGAEDFIRERLNNDIIFVDVNSSELSREELYDTDMVLAAIYLAGKMKSEAMYELLSERFRSCAESNEVFLEKIVAAMSEPEAEKFVLELLNDDGLPDSKRAYAMQMAVNSGLRNDEIYGAMKKCFKKLAEKENSDIIGAMLMCDYGDGRIVPAMRRLAMSKISQVNPEEKSDNTQIYILLSMINKLGGNTSDMTGGKNLFK